MARIDEFYNFIADLLDTAQESIPEGARLKLLTTDVDDYGARLNIAIGYEPPAPSFTQGLGAANTKQPAGSQFFSLNQGPTGPVNPWTA